MLTAKARVHRTLRGFGDLHHYWDSVASHWIVQVLPGEYYVTNQDEIITTVLGSCVSTCIRDRVRGVAGINHFMLPQEPGAEIKGAALRYGSYAIERLINELVKHGATHQDLEVKVFGGGSVIAAQSDIGASNVRFVRQYFADEGIAIGVEDVGGPWARRLRYHSLQGRALVKHLPVGEAADIAERERSFHNRLAQEKVTGEVELF